MTGVYQVRHYAHRLPHDVLVAEGDTFPPCSRCGRQVRFQIVERYGLQHFQSDPDLRKVDGKSVDQPAG
jgi:hypothetical protein